MSDPVPSRVVGFSEASRIVLEHAAFIAGSHCLSHECIPLLSSVGRVLAQSIRADRDQPPFPRSTRDGFACRAADLNRGGKLKVIGQVRAGESWPPPGAQSKNQDLIASGEAVEIMTGAPVPGGADCVVMIEHVDRDADNIRLSGDGRGRSLSAGDNIVLAGAEARAGDVVLVAGMPLTAARIAMAAACGATELEVFVRPQVAIVSTGDELVEVSQSPLPYQIRNSNSYSLAAQVLDAGGEPVPLGIVPDDLVRIGAAVDAALVADLILLSGGVSMGKYDLVEEVLLSRGAEFFFTGARIQPGKPVVFGRLPTQHGLKYFLGLPGNPLSTLVTFSLFAEPLLGAVCGRQPSGPRFCQAKLKTRITTKTGLTRFLPALLESGLADAGEPILESRFETLVAPVASLGSGDLASASRANCFLVVPPDRDSIESGETVTVLL